MSVTPLDERRVPESRKGSTGIRDQEDSQDDGEGAVVVGEGTGGQGRRMGMREGSGCPEGEVVKREG